jgi:hypothetical protein
MTKGLDEALRTSSDLREALEWAWAAGFAANEVWRERQRANGPMCDVPAPPNPHAASDPDAPGVDFDYIATGRAFHACAERIAKARKDGANGWDDPARTSEDSLLAGLLRNAHDGQIEDAMAYAVFLWNRKEKVK